MCIIVTEEDLFQKHAKKVQFFCPFSNLPRGVAASRFVGRQDLMAYKGLVLILGSMITIPMVWSM